MTFQSLHCLSIYVPYIGDGVGSLYGKVLFKRDSHCKTGNNFVVCLHVCTLGTLDLQQVDSKADMWLCGCVDVCMCGCGISSHRGIASPSFSIDPSK